MGTQSNYVGFKLADNLKSYIERARGTRSLSEFIKAILDEHRWRSASDPEGELRKRRLAHEIEMMRDFRPEFHRGVVGLVDALANSSSSPEVLGNHIREILDAESLLDAHLLALTRWIAEYYLCPWGEVIRTALPPGIDALVRQVASVTDAGRGALDGNGMLRQDERDMLTFVRGRGSTPTSTLTRRFPQAAAHVHALARRGLLTVAAEMHSARVRPLSVSYCSVAPGVDPEIVPLPAQARKQRTILKTLAGAPGGLPRADAAAGNPAALATLIRKGLVQVHTVEVTRDPFAAAAEASDAPKALAPMQAQALESIRSPIADRRFLPILLHGVTGSGKTEVYLQAIEMVLAQGPGCPRRRRPCSQRTAPRDARERPRGPLRACGT